MKTMTVEELDGQLAAVIGQLRPGEEVLLTRAAAPVARLVAESNPSPTRSHGTLRGSVLRIADRGRLRRAARRFRGLYEVRAIVDSHVLVGAVDDPSRLSGAVYCSSRNASKRRYSNPSRLVRISMPFLVIAMTCSTWTLG